MPRVTDLVTAFISWCCYSKHLLLVYGLLLETVRHTVEGVSRYMQNDAERNERIKKLAELIKDIKFAMLTTVEEDGSLRSRPMATQQTEFDGDLWFFTGASSHKVYDIDNNPHVNVVFAEPDDQSYVSISGRAYLVRDQQKAKDLWNPFYRTWFPDGLDDPDLALLKVEVTGAEYWDSPSSAVVHLYGLAKALVTGQRPQPGDNEKLDLTNTAGA
jgi:general stress protein 26